MHPQPAPHAIALGRLAMLATVACWAVYVVTTVLRELVENDDFDLRLTLELVSYLVVVTFLTFSALMYLIARQGALYRFRDHRRVPRAELDRHFDGGYDRRITVLVPSYIEEPAVVRQTLWSAALQEFPDLR
ncbi:glycosyltransferase, partial [Puerhibacterium sp. TATVAM-FAB25]